MINIPSCGYLRCVCFYYFAYYYYLLQIIMKKTACILFSAFFCLVCTAQKNVTEDSLYGMMAKAKTDDEKINAVIALSNYLSIQKPESCLIVTSKGKQLALKNNDSLSYATLLRIDGVALYFSGNYDKAAENHYAAAGICERNNYQKELALVLTELAKLYRKTKELDRSLNFYNSALAIYKSLKDQEGMATIYNESGVVYEYKGNFEEAIRLYNESLQTRIQMKDSVGIGYSLNFIGGAYTQLEQYDKAAENLMESLNIRLLLKDSFSVALSYSDLGFMYKLKGTVEKAKENYDASNRIAANIGYLELQKTNYKSLSEIESAAGNYKASLNYLEKFMQLQDSVFGIEKFKQVEELNAKYQTAKKEKEIQQQQFLLTKKNYLIGGVSGLFILGALLAFSYYRRNQLKQEKKLQYAIMQQQDLATKAVIDAEEKERKRIAGDLHDGVGQMMSAAKMNLSGFESRINFTDENEKIAFEKIISLVDESCKEVRNVSHNMMPNALLKSGLSNAVKEFIEKIDSAVLKVNLYAEGLKDRLDSNVETVLYRVIQECVNNVIKHSEADTLDISLIKDKDGIAATIEDNGKGFDTSNKEKFEGIGLKNIKTRIDYLKGTVDFDSAPGKGTLVAIHVPLG